MASEFLAKMTLTKWIVAALVLAAVVLFYLFNFTSFQVPKTITQGKQEPQVGGGIVVRGTTVTCNNLDAVYNKIYGLPECVTERANDEASNDE